MRFSRPQNTLLSVTKQNFPALLNRWDNTDKTLPLHSDIAIEGSLVTNKPYPQPASVLKDKVGNSNMLTTINGVTDGVAIFYSHPASDTAWSWDTGNPGFINLSEAIQLGTNSVKPFLMIMSGGFSAASSAIGFGDVINGATPYFSSSINGAQYLGVDVNNYQGNPNFITAPQSIVIPAVGCLIIAVDPVNNTARKVFFDRNNTAQLHIANMLAGAGTLNGDWQTGMETGVTLPLGDDTIADRFIEAINIMQFEAMPTDAELLRMASWIGHNPVHLPPWLEGRV